MNIRFLIFISASLLFVFFSCGGEKTPSANNMKYELVKFEKQSEGCDSLRDDNCAKIKIEFPQITEFGNEAIKNKINNSIKNLFSSNDGGTTGEVDFNSQMKSFIGDYESFMKEFPDAFQSWFIERTGEVKFNKEDIFSIDYMEYSYTGGAHPNTFVTFKNFYLNDGEEISLDKIILGEKQNELNKIAEVEFRKLKELTPDADLGQAGFWFENNKFYLNENFLIGDSSLVFYYNNYEITAYAFGPTELEIPYSIIKNLINENSLIANLLD
ncbi:MAG: DUF3298 and DUF4163 domain-containing protein [Ignavibacteriaceae bacterium]|nr:DUF3298 and DUF4163 domain-containing protein [Ignavibacteriaceae bacterium]